MTRVLALLEKLVALLDSGQELESCLAQALELMLRELKLETGWVWLLEPHSQKIYLAASARLPRALAEPVRMTGKTCRCLDGFLKGELGPSSVDRIACSRLREVEVEGSHTSFPLSFGGRPLGLLNLGFRELDPDEVRLLALACHQLGALVERSRMAEEREQFARQHERERLARELHDTLAQSFTAIGLQLEGAEMALEGRIEVARQRLQKALAISREGVETTREVVFDLRGHEPLAAGLRKLSRAFTSRSGIPVQASLAVLSLDAESEQQLLRIAGEALHNVERHAAASRVTLRLEARETGYRLSIEDDGRGLSGKEGLGLTGMRERAQAISARLTLTSDQGGTRVEVEKR